MPLPMLGSCGRRRIDLKKVTTWNPWSTSLRMLGALRTRRAAKRGFARPRRERRTPSNSRRRAPATSSRVSTRSSWYLCSALESSATHLVPAPSKTTRASSPGSLNSLAVVSAFATRPSPSDESVSARTIRAALDIALPVDRLTRVLRRAGRLIILGSGDFTRDSPSIFEASRSRTRYVLELGGEAALSSLRSGRGDGGCAPACTHGARAGQLVWPRR